MISGTVTEVLSHSISAVKPEILWLAFFGKLPRRAVRGSILLKAQLRLAILHAKLTMLFASSVQLNWLKMWDTANK